MDIRCIEVLLQRRYVVVFGNSTYIQSVVEELLESIAMNLYVDCSLSANFQ